MTAANGQVAMRWMPGLAPGCPGAVDLTTTGPQGTIERAVTLSEALTMALVIDVLCPAPSHLYETVSQFAADHPTPRRLDR